MTSLLDPSHVHNTFPRAPSGLKNIQYASPIVYSMNALLDRGKTKCGAPWRQFCDWCSKERYIPVLECEFTCATVYACRGAVIREYAFPTNILLLPKRIPTITVR